MSRVEGFADLLGRTAALADADLARFVDGLPTPVRRAIGEAWSWQAHGGQVAPPGDWNVWLMMAGRGFGKTRAGAEWVSELARADGSIRIALVGATMDEVAKVMVEGESGLMAVARTGEAPRWVASRGVLTFASGAEAFAFSGETPEKLRGPQHHFAWCDELAKWRYAQKTWDNLMLGLRLGLRPRTVVTTTPRPGALLATLIAAPGTHVTRGATAANPHLPDAYLAAVTAAYAGKRIGRQELDGELIEDVEGALWPRGLIEACRGPAVVERDERFARVVIGVDPPAGSASDGASTSRRTGDACGIVVVGRDGQDIAHVLADASVAGLGPDGWARAVAAAAARWRAERVVAEANNGGRMVASVLLAAEAGLPLRLVHASEGKVARAEPVAALFERKRARFAGTFPALEDELAGLATGGAYRGPGRSPDRADACVWAMTELMLTPAAVPRIVGL